MHWRISILATLIALPLFSDPAQIMYYRFFGDYLAENSYDVDIDLVNVSLAEIKSKLASLRNSPYAINADLVVIGYGHVGAPEEFFAATTFIDYHVPLQTALVNLPPSAPQAKWYIYFIDKSHSGYVRARKKHHWASPFQWLAEIGLQNLHYFAPF